MIPGNDIPTTTDDLLQLIGKYATQYEMEQRKRAILISVFEQLQSELAAVKSELWQLKNPDVVQGNP